MCSVCEGDIEKQLQTVSTLIIVVAVSLEFNRSKNFDKEMKTNSYTFRGDVLGNHNTI